MPKRRTIIVLLLAAVAMAVGAIVFITPPREPSYKGVPLSQWLFRYHRWRHKEARRAIRQIGTNAIPHLMRTIQSAPPPWVTHLADLMDRIGFNSLRVRVILAERTSRAEAAWDGLEVLGPQGRVAMPALLVLLHDPKEPETAGRAAAALGRIGKPALGPLLNELTNGSPKRRYLIIGALADMQTNAAPAVPFLLDLAQAKDPNVAEASIYALWAIGCEDEDFLPAVTKGLLNQDAGVRKRAAWHFPSWAKDACSSAPALQQLLNDPDPETRAAASAALRAIAPDLLTNATPPKSP